MDWLSEVLLMLGGLMKYRIGVLFCGVSLCIVRYLMIWFLIFFRLKWLVFRMVCVFLMLIGFFVGRV